MPTIDDVRRVLTVATSAHELDFFFSQLTTADWIPALIEAGLLDSPPEPIEDTRGIAFPGWGVSQYLARVAEQSPDMTLQALERIEGSNNPRVWRDIVAALCVLPPEYAARFIESIARWVHHPHSLGLSYDVTKLVDHLIEHDAGDLVVALIDSLAMLTPPEGWPDDMPWEPIEEYQYRESLPRLVAEAGRFGVSLPRILIANLERYLDAERGDRDTQRDGSIIWRPAIEDHEQNEDFDLHAVLGRTTRDSLERAIDAEPASLSAWVEDLLTRRWAILRRIAIHLVNSHGDGHPELVARILTDPELFGDVDLHHEFYLLAANHFGSLAPEYQASYVRLVDVAAAEATANDEAGIAVRRRQWWARNRLGAVAHDLSGEALDRYQHLVAEFGEAEHPEFLTYHTSWSGPTSPATADELRAKTPDEIVQYLREWEPDGDEMRPSPEGLARVLSGIVAEDPAKYAPSARLYADLEPAYGRNFLSGLREALRSDKAFDWESVLDLCSAIVAQPSLDAEIGIGGERDPGWSWSRTEVAHLLETGLESRPGRIPASLHAQVWDVIRVLAADPDPTPEAEATHISAMGDPFTYSINTTRGVAIHALCRFAVRLWEEADSSPDWRLSDAEPEVATLLAEHMEPGADASVAIGAAFGRWIAWLVAMDPPWAADRMETLLGGLATDRQVACWESYLVSSTGNKASYAVLARWYETYALMLRDLETEPERRGGGDAIDAFIHHLIRLREILPDDGGPMDVMVRTGEPWLISAIVTESGRMIRRTAEISDDLATSLISIWKRIRAIVETRPDRAAVEALAPFGWWFATSLPVARTMPELLWLADQQVSPDPEFLVVERLADVAAEYPREALTVVEQIDRQAVHDWVLRGHENELRTILAAGLRVSDDLVRVRAEGLIHRLGRKGLQGLASLLEQRSP